MTASKIDDGSPEPAHLVVLIHGINTRALWMSAIEPTLRSAGFVVARTSYGHFSILRFLVPYDRLRRYAIRRVANDIKTAIAIHNPGRISAIAHSFGTYILAKILQREHNLHWHRIIFCGSVVREDFPLDQLLNQFDYPLLNEIGTHDVWPAVAESATWGYGSAGSTGFNRPPVETRWHAGFRHSDFLKSDFCRRFWVPFLREGAIRPGTAPTALPNFVRVILWLPLRWIILGLAAIGLVACYLFFAGIR